MSKVLNVILKTIKDVQEKNAQNPNVPTADPSVFDLLRNKIQQVDQKVQTKQMQKGRKNPKSILDMIKDGIEGARKENKKDKNVETAPGSVFDNILKKVNQTEQRQVNSGIKKIVTDYNLDVSRIPREMIQQIQQQYQGDLQKMNQQYAQAIHDITKKIR